MSLTWRERLARAKRRLMEEMNLSERDFREIQNNIGSYCRESDEQTKLVYGKYCNVDDKVGKMTEQQFIEVTKDVIEKVMEILGYIPERKRKKKIKKEVRSENQEEQKTEEETANEIEHEEKEQEIVAQ